MKFVLTDDERDILKVIAQQGCVKPDIECNECPLYPGLCDENDDIEIGSKRILENEYVERN